MLVHLNRIGICVPQIFCQKHRTCQIKKDLNAKGSELRGFTPQAKFISQKDFE
jgi:hypothetical protein